MVKFAITIKQKYWDMKMEDEKEWGFFYEYKAMTKHWKSRMPKIKAALAGKEVVEGVFNIGRISNKRRVLAVGEAVTKNIPGKYSGAIDTGECFYLRCVPLDDADLTEGC